MERKPCITTLALIFHDTGYQPPDLIYTCWLAAVPTSHHGCPQYQGWGHQVVAWLHSYCCYGDTWPWANTGTCWITVISVWTRGEGGGGWRGGGWWWSLSKGQRAKSLGFWPYRGRHSGQQQGKGGVEESLALNHISHSPLPEQGITLDIYTLAFWKQAQQSKAHRAGGVYGKLYLLSDFLQSTPRSLMAFWPFTWP